MLETLGHNNQILVVEDDDIDFSYIQYCLRQSSLGDIEIERASTIAQADALMSQNTYGVIVLDYHVNDRTPASLARHIEKPSAGPVVMILSSAPVPMLSELAKAFETSLLIDKSSMTPAKISAALKTATTALDQAC